MPINRTLKTIDGNIEYVENRISNKVAIIVHGFAASKSSKATLKLQYIAEKLGFSTISFDLFNHGNSDGNFVDMTITRNIKSLIHIINFTKEKYNKVTIFASSMGGLVSLFAIKSSPIDGLVLRSPVINNQGKIISNYLKIKLSEWKKRENYSLKDKKGNTNILSYNFFLDAQKYDALTLVNLFNNPIIIFHGDNDDFVPYLASKKFSEQIIQSKFICIKNTTHFFSDSDYETMENTLIEILAKTL